MPEVAFPDRTPIGVRAYSSCDTGVFQLRYGRTPVAIRSTNALTGTRKCLQGEEQRQHQHHDNAHDNLEGQAHTHIVDETVLAGLHDQGVGRRAERRGETHAGAQRDGEEVGKIGRASCRERV